MLGKFLSFFEYYLLNQLRLECEVWSELRVPLSSPSVLEGGDRLRYNTSLKVGI